LYAVQLGQLSSVELCRYKHPFNCIKNKNKIKYGEKRFSIWRMEFLLCKSEVIFAHQIIISNCQILFIFILFLNAVWTLASGGFRIVSDTLVYI